MLRTIARVMFCISLLHHNSHNVRGGLNIPVTSTSSQVDTDSIGSTLVMEVRYQRFVLYFVVHLSLMCARHCKGNLHPAFIFVEVKCLLHIFLSSNFTASE
jgi:hypothetical protein